MIDQEDQGEKFLQRWSRLKRATEAPLRDDSEPALRKTSDADPDALPQTVAQSGVDLTAFDPTTLPPIESISASSDIRAFLAPGVPAALKRAALRRAWVTDPAIRDFVGVAENQWDFNKPDSIPGFGSLELTPELCRMVAGLFGDPPIETTPPRDAGMEPLEQSHVPGILPELPSAPAAAPRESDAKPERSPAQAGEVHAGAVEFALPGHSDDEAVPPIDSMQESVRPKK